MIHLYNYMIYLNAFSQGGSWIAKSQDVNQWIQAEFGNNFKITAIQTQGRFTTNPIHSQWVEAFKISYSNNGAVWNVFRNSDGTEKVGAGSSRLYMRVKNTSCFYM